MLNTHSCIFHRGVNGSEPLLPVVNGVNICGNPRIISCCLLPLVNPCKPMSTGFDFVAIKKSRTFTAIENDEIRRKMGQQARIDVERFKIEQIAEQWKQLFESLTLKN